MQILDGDLGAVGLRADTVVAVVDHAVQDDNVRAPVSIPAISVPRRAFALTRARYVGIVECDARTIGDPVVILG